MGDTEKRIADMIAGMDFSRKKPPKKQKKAAYAAIKTELDDIAHDIEALRLALWHAEYRRDYHKLSPDDIKTRLEELSRRIDAICRQHLRDPGAMDG